MRPFLLSQVLATFWPQRNYLPLQGSAIATAHGAMIFAGISGSGKSALAAAFAARGYPVLAEEISMVTFGRQGAPQLLPSGGQSQLWFQAVQQLGRRGEVGRAIQAELEKSALPNPQLIDTQLQPVYCLYILQAAQVTAVQLQRLTGVAKLAPLQHILYYPQLPPDLQKRNALLLQLAQLANQVEVQLLTRPRLRFAITQLVDLLEAEWQSLR